MKRQHIFWLSVTAVLYTVAVAVSNLLIPIFINLGPLGMLSAGTLTFGLTFTLRDIAHQTSARAGLGRTPIFLMIAVAAVVNVIVAAIIGTPSRFLIASFGAMLVGKADTVLVEHARLVDDDPLAAG